MQTAQTYQFQSYGQLAILYLSTLLPTSRCCKLLIAPSSDGNVCSLLPFKCKTRSLCSRSRSSDGRLVSLLPERYSASSWVLFDNVLLGIS